MPTSSNQAEQSKYLVTSTYYLVSTSDGTSGGDSKTGVIAGATVGAIAVAVVGLIIILLVICWYHRILCFKQKSVNQKGLFTHTLKVNLSSYSLRQT